MRKLSYVMVANLKSRKASLAIDEIKKGFRKQKVKVNFIEVKRPSRLPDAFQRAIDSKPDVIVLGGGDGTLISGIEYMTKNSYKNKIGILPLGTANYLARNLNIPLTVPESLEVLLKGKVRDIPIGVANDKYFALTFIIGLTQAVSENVSDGLKKKIGQLAYVAELLKQTRQHKSFEYSLELPDKNKIITGTSHQILVYNSDINQQLKLVPEHRLEKNSLKVVISKSGSSKTKLIMGFVAHMLTLGRFSPYMRVFETQSLNITTDPALPADFDGETYGKSPFSVSLSEQKIRLIC